MKLFAFFSAVQAGIGDGARQLRSFEDHENCVNNTDNRSINPFNPPSYAPFGLMGVQLCAGPVCQLHRCNDGYQGIPLFEGAVKRMKCKYDKRTDEYTWNKPGLWYCQTCTNLEPLHNNPDFNVNCEYVNKGGYNLKVCNIECANGEKIFPLNKPRAKNVICKCDKRSKECHWKKGSLFFDQGDHLGFSKWSCPEI